MLRQPKIHVYTHIPRGEGELKPRERRQIGQKGCPFPSGQQIPLLCVVLGLQRVLFLVCIRLLLYLPCILRAFYGPSVL